MSRRGMDGKFLDFPLCCLAYINCERERLEEIAFFCVAEHAKKFRDDYTAKEKMRTTDYIFIKADDLKPNNELHQEIALASLDLEITLDNMGNTIAIWNEIKLFIQIYEHKYGKDAYCRVGRQLTFEAIDGKIPMGHFLVLCAVQSILGKKSLYKRITYKSILTRVTGYKTRDIAVTLNPDVYFLTDRQITQSITFLKKKELLNTFTYKRRVKYYSTKLKGESLAEAVFKNKIKKAEKENAVDRDWSNKIHSEIARIEKTKKRSNYFFIDET